jgi:hypothetical protein
LPDLVWLSVVREELAYCELVSLVVVQDSSPPLCCGLCAWTQTALPRQNAAAMIDFNKRFDKGLSAGPCASGAVPGDMPFNVIKAMWV